MALHLYKDGLLTQQISEGDMTNPDSDTYNGTDGESRDREIFIANEQTALSGAVTNSQTNLPLAQPRFVNGEVIVAEDEQMLVTAGGGTTSLTVQRGYNGTAAAAHASGIAVYSAFNYTNLKVKPIDTSGSDESGWCALALTQAELETAVAGTELTLGDKAYGAAISFWRRFTVPAGTPVQNKLDIKLRLTGTETPV